MTAEGKAPPIRVAQSGFLARLASQPLLPALAVAGAFIAAIALYWSGVGPGDAENYIAFALDWSERGPLLGENHWQLRHLFVLPMAGAFALLGASEVAATLPNILYAAGVVTVTFIFARKYLWDGAGIAAAGLVALSAFLVEMQFEVRIDGAQLFFEALAAWLFIAGLQGASGAARR
ncbi:MAG: glycosyltransferase family 39 protein, partial [Parvularculaceae bacterium]